MKSWPLTSKLISQHIKLLKHLIFWFRAQWHPMLLWSHCRPCSVEDLSSVNFIWLFYGSLLRPSDTLSQGKLHGGDAYRLLKALLEILFHESWLCVLYCRRVFQRPLKESHLLDWLDCVQASLADGLTVPTVGVNAFATGAPIIDKVCSFVLELRHHQTDFTKWPKSFWSLKIDQILTRILEEGNLKHYAI